MPTPATAAAPAPATVRRRTDAERLAAHARRELLRIERHVVAAHRPGIRRSTSAEIAEVYAREILGPMGARTAGA